MASRDDVLAMHVFAAETWKPLEAAARGLESEDRKRRRDWAKNSADRALVKLSDELACVRADFNSILASLILPLVAKSWPTAFLHWHRR